MWRQIESFGGYSFSKAHSASFAVESYQSLFLKTYFPVEFMVAVINNFGGFYSRELYFQELKRTGAIIQPPCLNRSEYATLVSGKNVFMGFVHVQGLEEQFMINVIADRKRNGVFAGLADFIERLAPGIEQLNILIRVGAFRFTGKTKKELLWEANFLNKKNTSPGGLGFLFRESPQQFHLPELVQHPLDDALDEIELLGFPLCNVFELAKLDPHEFLPAAELQHYLGKQVSVLGYLVTSKPVNTITNDHAFHTFLDSAGWRYNFLLTSRYHPVTAGSLPMREKLLKNSCFPWVQITRDRPA